jgi:hypothetical protein
VNRFSAKLRVLPDVVVAAAAVAILALFAAVATDAQTLDEVTVKSGRWHGIKWEFRAQTWSDGSYCLAMNVSGSERARGCGSIRKDRISYMAGGGSRIPAYVAGPVVANARSVDVRFFDRPPLRLSTIPPPAALYRGNRFFAAVLPCPVTPRSFVARSAKGRIVARLVVPERFPKSRC